MEVVVELLKSGGSSFVVGGAITYLAFEVRRLATAVEKYGKTIENHEGRISHIEGQLDK